MTGTQELIIDVPSSEWLSAERMQPEQADPTDAEIWAAARAVFETRAAHSPTTTTTRRTP